MPEQKKCRTCGTDIQSNAPFGQCPQCLLALGFGPIPKEAIESPVESTAPSPSALPELRANPDTASPSETDRAPADAIKEKPGDRIGRYKLLEKIGEGGCGVVYMAEQEVPVRRRVALKVIKAGMDTREVIARFEAERQALALMDHPHIARIFDGGATDTGRPYFVMELVRGIRITEYCDHKNLSTRQRLDLFMQICQAVQHAHQKGVIHRDLKPSNILVTVNDGVPVPKVIDFGIAKATGQALTDKTLFTRFRQLIGTPAYMSPEQAEMTSVDIDTRSDIYSLGVLLYELLTGRTPFDTKEVLRAGFEEMLRTIREQEPVRPSARLSTLAAADLTTVARQRQTEAPKLIRLLRGDLDWITLKCLEKDRTRRYETANGLASDVHRHLTNEPVLARPPSNLYRMQKTVRRHKLAFAAATAVLVSLLLGLGSATTMFFKEQAALRKAEAAHTEVAQQKTEVDRKNAEFRAMLVEAARSDRLVAEEKFRLGQEQWAFAHLARACEYDPSSTLAAEKGIAALGTWNHELPNKTLATHTKGLTSAQFSRDGSRIVTASFDKTACVWDVATGQMMVTLAGHTGIVWNAQFSPDGTRIVTTSKDKSARVWDTATGKTLATLAGHTNDVSSAEFSQDGTRIVTAGGKTAHVWDAQSGDALVTLPGYTRASMTAHFSPDGTRILTAGDRTARVWDAVMGKLLATLDGHTGDVRSARFNGEGTRIVTASWDGTARVWDAATGGVLATLAGHDGEVDSAEFSPDGTRIVTAGRGDKTVRIWAAGTGKLLRTLAGHEGEVHTAQFSPDGNRIVSVAGQKSESDARVWHASTGKLLATLSGHQSGMWSAQFSPDGKHIVTASEDTTARVWDADTMRATLATPYGLVEFSPDGTRVVTASPENNTSPRLWDATTGKTLATLGDQGPVKSAQFSPNGSRIITTSGRTVADLWDSATGKGLATLGGYTGVVMLAQFSPDGTRIVTASFNEPVRVWDTETGKTLTTLGNRALGTIPQFSPDGTRIATASDDKPVRVWDTETGKTLATLGNLAWVTSAQFSPDGTRMVTASYDLATSVVNIATGQLDVRPVTPGQISVWDIATGKMLVALVGHTGEVRSAQFSLDGTRIITTELNNEPARLWDATTGKTLATLGKRASLDSPQFSPDGKRIITNPGIVRNPGGAIAELWDSGTGKALAKLTGHTGIVRSAQFSSDGTRIVTASEDETIRVWDAATGRELAMVSGPEGVLGVEQVMAKMANAAGRESLLRSAQVSSDGTRIYSTSNDGSVRLWDVLTKNAGPPPEWFPDFLRYIAQMRLNSDGELETLKPADWLALRERLRGVLRTHAGEDTPYLRILRRYVRE